MKRIGLRGKLMIGMFLILCVSIGLVAGQAVNLFRQDKSSYVFDLNASQAIRIADEIQGNVHHLTEKMQIFSQAITLRPPEGVDPKEFFISMLRRYPEYLLFSRRGGDETLRMVFQSPSLRKAGLSVDALHQAYEGGKIPFDTLIADRPFLAHFDLSRSLPTFTLVVRSQPGADGKPGPALVAECPVNRLYDARNESSLYEIYVTDSSGKPFLSFAGEEPVATGDEAAAPSFADLLPDSARTAGTQEYLASGVPMLAAYAPVGDLGLWTVVQIPKARALAAARRLVTRSLVIAGMVCVAGIGLVLLIAQSITKPLVALTKATEQIGQGNYDVVVPVSGGDEIGALGERFTRMTEELSTREEALKDANLRLMESEKMTALGQLGAGIAHEVKNPLTSIRGYAQMGIRKIEPGHPLADYFKTIEKETGRSLEILKNLLKFSRQETAELTPIDLNTVVVDTVKLVTHQLSMKKVELESNIYEQPLKVMGNSNQIEQVLLNLFMNAGDAMDGGGTLTVTTDIHGKSARVRATDTGNGIPEELLAKIFNPFFTTKPVGKGTGLGLSVSYGIIKEHKGDISAKSEPGKGTTFTIMIPLREDAAETETPAPAQGADTRVRVISLR